MSLARKILGNTVAQVVGRFATALLAVVVVKILTVYLGQSGYGQYATIYEFLAFFGAFADFGIFTIAVREMSKHPKKEEEIFGNTLTLRTAFTAGAMLIASGVAFLIPQYQGTVIPLGVCIAALSTFFVILSGTLSAALQIKLRMEVAAFALVIGKVFTVLFIFLLTQSFFPEASEASFFWLIWAGSLGAGMTFLLTLLFTRRIFKIHFLFSWKQAKQLLIEAAPFAVALALNTFYIRMDILLLSLLLPVSDNGECVQHFCGDMEVGMYAVGARILEIFLMVPIYFMNSVLPTLTQYIGKKSKKLTNLLQHAFLFLFTVGLPAGALLFLFSREITLLISSDSFLSTTEYAGADTALSILAIMIPIAFCSIFFGFLLIASGKQKLLIWINLGAVAFNLFLDFWAIPKFGFVGAAWSSVASECVMLLLMILVSTHIIRFVPRGIALLKVLFSLFLSLVFVWSLLPLISPLGAFFSFIIGSIVFSALYLLLLSIFRILTRDMFLLLKKGSAEMKAE